MTDPYRIAPSGWQPDPLEHAPPIPFSEAWFKHVVLANDLHLDDVRFHSPSPGALAVTLTVHPTLLCYDAQIEDAARRIIERELPVGTRLESITLEWT